jgi:AcrR family transcriptional regulator
VGARAQRTEARREAIVEAALALFATHGYRGTSIEAVAEKVGISDAGVLYHFNSKADLLLAVLAHHDARWATMVQESRVEGPLGELHRLEEWGVEMERDPDLTALLVTLSAEHLRDDTPTNAYFRGRYKVVMDGYEAMFRAAAKDGLIRKDVDARAESIALAAMLDGIRLQMFFVKGVSVADAVRRYVRTTMERLAT